MRIKKLELFYLCKMLVLRILNFTLHRFTVLEKVATGLKYEKIFILSFLGVFKGVGIKNTLPSKIFTS